MQIDFHHTATYVTARSAGFGHRKADTIAYAAQYVDDAINSGTLRFHNGPCIPESALPTKCSITGILRNWPTIMCGSPFTSCLATVGKRQVKTLPTESLRFPGQRKSTQG